MFRKTKLKPLRHIFLLISTIVISTIVFAQSAINGTVIDATTAKPIAGVSVSVKNSNAGTTTDESGAFTVAAMPTDILVFSAVGYKQIEWPASADLSNILLTSEAQDLEQVVLVGYTTKKKETLTGAIATVNAESFQEKGALVSPLQALQGQVPGVIITRSSSAPGDEAWAVKLRGAVSVNSTEPLVIIDGVAADSYRDLRLINSNDIENISFLKDAAAAIYGSRAAGGVILVTTKKGKTGKARVEYDGITHKKIFSIY